jgi:hypothetical protein
MGEATDATLTRSAKNRILELVNRYGPSPIDFRWSETQQGEWQSTSQYQYRVSVLTHIPTGYYCIFGAHSIEICPGFTRNIQDFRHEDNLDRKENLCGKWLMIVKSEADTSDLWASVAQETALPKAASLPSLDNRLFTPTEQKLIVEKLDEIKGFLVEGQQFATEQAETIEREFAYLKDAAERLGRKHWLNGLLGGLIGLAITLGLDPEKTKGILRLAGEAFQSLWGMAAGYLN